LNSTSISTTTAQTASEPLLPYLEMGTGFLIGLSIGYVIKKSFKILLFLLGIGIITVFVLESKGVITLNEEHLQNTVSQGTDVFKYFVTFLKDRLEHFEVSSGLSAVAGFFVGIKMG